MAPVGRVWYKGGQWISSLGMWEKEAIMGFWEFVVIMVVIESIRKIISRWLKTKEGVTQRQVQALEQRIQVLETDVQKRIGVLEEIFVTEDFELQRKLRYALGSNSLTTSSHTENQSK